MKTNEWREAEGGNSVKRVKKKKKRLEERDE